MAADCVQVVLLEVFHGRPISTRGATRGATSIRDAPPGTEWLSVANHYLQEVPRDIPQGVDHDSVGTTSPPEGCTSLWDIGLQIPAWTRVS